MAREITAAAGGTTREVYGGYSRAWPLTIATWLRFSTGTDAYPFAFSITGTSTSDNIAIGQTDQGDSYQIMYLVWEEGGTYEALTAGGAPTADRWYAVVGRSSGASSHELDIYDPVGDNTYNTTGTTTVGTLALTDTVCGNGYGAGWTHGLDGAWAEPAIWSAALSDEEVAAYLAGVSPLLIRPSALTWHGSQIRGNRPDVIGGTTGTETGTIVEAAHPPGIIYPSVTQAPLVSDWGRAVDVVSSAPASSGVVQESYIRLGQSLADLKAGEAFRIRLSRSTTHSADSMSDDAGLIRAELVEVADG